MKLSASVMIVSLSAFLFAAAPGSSQEMRPQAGEGSIFINTDVLRARFVDFDNDTLIVTFPSGTNAGGFARRSPDGTDFIHVQERVAQFSVALGTGGTFVGSGRFEISAYVVCPVFDPVNQTFQCISRTVETRMINMIASGTVQSPTGDLFRLEARIVRNPEFNFDDPLKNQIDVTPITAKPQVPLRAWTWVKRLYN